MFRNKVLYFMILIEVCILSVLYNAYEPIALLWIALLMPVFLIIEVRIKAHFIKVQIEDENVAVTRQSDREMIIEVENRSIFPTGAVCIHGKTDDNNFLINLYIGGGDTIKAVYPVNCEICGIRKVVISKLVVFDALKIFKRTIRLNKNIRVMVVPKIYEVEQSAISDSMGYDGDSNIYSEKYPGDDSSEIFDIREYQEGDRLSRIHWKLTTKMNRLMVKEFSMQLPDGIDILLNTKNGDERIDILFSIGLAVIGDNGKVRINGEVTESEEDYIAEFLKALDAENTEAQKEVMSGIVQDGGRKILCCIEDIQPDAAELLIQMAERNSVFLICKNETSGDVFLANGVCVCDTAMQDAASIIERIINE